MKRVRESGADRITDLPDDVIQRILVFLPIKDVAKASLLSRKWRYHWRSTPQLIFDDSFAPYSQLYELSESECKARSKLIMLNIYKYLLVHDGPLTKFELSVSGLESYNEVDHIVLYLSSKGVQDIALVFFGSNIGIEDYQMHTSLFSDLHLRSLRLQSCAFTPPAWFAGFTKLTGLELVNVVLPCDFFTDFLPKCPMLEFLTAIECIGPAGKLEVVAPLLKSFIFVGSFLDIYFKCTPLLSRVVLGLSDTNTFDVVSFFASLPALREFHVNPDILKLLPAGDGNVPTRLPTPLHGLKVLDMNSIIFDSPEIERVFACLIRSSPNLRRLTVQLERAELHDHHANDVVSRILWLLEAEDCCDCLQHLREFRIEESRGTQVELDLARFVLGVAPLLRMVHITPFDELGYKTAMKFMKEVMQYKRVSKEAEVIYDWKDNED